MNELRRFLELARYGRPDALDDAERHLSFHQTGELVADVVGRLTRLPEALARVVSALGGVTSRNGL